MLKWKQTFVMSYREAKKGGTDLVLLLSETAS